MLCAYCLYDVRVLCLDVVCMRHVCVIICIMCYVCGRNTVWVVYMLCMHGVLCMSCMCIVCVYARGVWCAYVLRVCGV